MKLVRELLFLSVLLLFSLLLLVINLSFFSDNSVLENVEKIELKKIKPIQNQIGKQLFKNNCAACHNRNMRDGLIGPALGGVRERWLVNDVAIYDFVRNSQVVIENGNEYANTLFEEWSPNKMPSFSNLEDKEIDSILDYIDEQFQRK